MIVINDLTGGGAERVATNLATCLSETENVTLVVEHITENTYGTSVKTIDLQMPIKKDKIKIFWSLRFAYKLRKLKKELKITHSISFLSVPNLANVISKRNEQVIVSVRNKMSERKNKLVRLKEKWIFRHADVVVALSEMIKYDLAKNFYVDEKKIITIYNPCYIDNIAKLMLEEQFSLREKEIMSKNKGNIILTAGRLTDQKGQWHLIRAFSKVVQVFPQAQLLILGKGKNESYLKSLVKDLGLQANVYFLGYKDNPYSYMYNADLFVFPSVYEGLGNVLLECMACGLPIISTDCDYGPRELLDPDSDFFDKVKDVTFAQYGVLIPPVDDYKYASNDLLVYSENKMAEAIIEMLKNKNLREEYESVVLERGKAFDYKAITKQWLDLLT